jgi:CubicO group peptidase (beta-lactamase class C family)
MRYLLLIYTNLVVFCIPAFSIPTNSTSSTPVTIKPQLSNEFLDGRIKVIMEQQKIPGMAVVVIKNGQVKVLKGYGLADINTKAPVVPETKFPIGSLTKQFTAMAIMMLVEEGKVNLDKPISQYINNLPSKWAPLTLRQLLGHTSGMSDDYSWEKVKQAQDLIQSGKPELDFPPGESWNYSNAGFLLTGVVIEKVSGQLYSDFVRDRIFTPLGMRETRAGLTPVPNLASGYTWNGGLAKLDLPKDRLIPGVGDAHAAGNIISTASDMAKWLQSLDQGKLLKASSYKQMWTATTLKNGRGTEYGLGWGVGSFNGHSYTQHSGGVSGYSAGLYRAPLDKLSVVVLTNNINAVGVGIATDIASIFEPSISPISLRPRPDPNPEITKRFLQLLQGNNKSIPFAPEFLLALKTMRGIFFAGEAKSFREINKLTFLHKEDQNGYSVYFYQTSFKGKTAYVSMRLTAQQQIADYRVFSPCCF